MLEPLTVGEQHAERAELHPHDPLRAVPAVTVDDGPGVAHACLLRRFREAGHETIDERQSGREFRQRAAVVARLERHAAARAANRRHGGGQVASEPGHEADVADQRHPRPSEQGQLPTDERHVGGTRRTDVMGKTPLTPRIDEHGAGTCRLGRVRLDPDDVDSRVCKPFPHDPPPQVVADQSGRRDLESERAQCDARVADDAARGEVERFDVHEPAAADRPREIDRPDDDIDSTGSEHEAVDVMWRHDAPGFGGRATRDHAPNRRHPWSMISSVPRRACAVHPFGSRHHASSATDVHPCRLPDRGVRMRPTGRAGAGRSSRRRQRDRRIALDAR